jgi:hypothetical protein
MSITGSNRVKLWRGSTCRLSLNAGFRFFLYTLEFFIVESIILEAPLIG